MGIDKKAQSSYLFELKSFSDFTQETMYLGEDKLSICIFENQDEKYIFNSNEILLMNDSVQTVQKESSVCRLVLDKSWCMGVQKRVFGEISNFIPLKNFKILDNSLYNEFRTLYKNSNNYSLTSNELEVFLEKLFTNYCDVNILKIEKAKIHMKERVCEKLSIEELCQFTELSKFYFIRLFKEVSNMTPHSYFVNLKVDKAKELLAEGMKSSEIAATIGLSDQSHLNRIFKTHLGITPNDYRKSLEMSA